MYQYVSLHCQWASQNIERDQELSLTIFYTQNKKNINFKFNEALVSNRFVCCWNVLMKEKLEGAGGRGEGLQGLTCLAKRVSGVFLAVTMLAELPKKFIL